MTSTLLEDPHFEPPPELNPPPCPETLVVGSRALGPPPSFQAPEPTLADAMSQPEAQRSFSFGALPFWNTGGTGGTGDFGWGSQAMMHVMAEQARLAESYQSYSLDCGVEMGSPEAGLPEGCGMELGLAEDPSAADPVWLQPQSLMGELFPHRLQVNPEADLGEEDSPLEAMGEAMVEDLVGEIDAEQDALAPLPAGGVSSFAYPGPLLEDALDAFNKVDAAREALSKVLDSAGLRTSAPTFVPGQMWTGQGRSSFVD